MVHGKIKQIWYTNPKTSFQIADTNNVHCTCNGEFKSFQDLVWKMSKDFCTFQYLGGNSGLFRVWKMDTSNFGLFGIFQHPLEPSFQWHSSRASLSFKTSPDSIPKSSSWPSTLQVLILILSWTCVLTRSLGKCTKILHYKMGMNFGSLYRTEW